ncbi:MAG: sulfotransferase domain-containing protein [Planctomycetes bacterium]|nr:sulfotransferase domain-containing protein [Planctomycetota bacterium]
MSDQHVPNFLYIGTSKAGSTWLYNLLNHHPDVFMAPGKGTYFFDRHFDKGLEWYRGHFRNAGDKKIVAEVSHSYLYSPEACQRIADLNPEMRLMVCLREPVDRAFSSYLDHVKNNKFRGDFETALKQLPILTDRGRYATHLAPYVKTFGVERIHVAVFDELTTDPAGFARKLFDFLDLTQIELSESLLKKRMPAGTPRWRWLTRTAKFVSRTARQIGLKSLVGKAKTSIAIRNMLYCEYRQNEKPQMMPATRERLQDQFADEIRRLDRLFGTEFQQLWQYSTESRQRNAADAVLEQHL